MLLQKLYNNWWFMLILSCIINLPAEKLAKDAKLCRFAGLISPKPAVELFNADRLGKPVTTIQLFY